MAQKDASEPLLLGKRGEIAVRIVVIRPRSGAKRKKLILGRRGVVPTIPPTERRFDLWLGCSPAPLPGTLDRRIESMAQQQQKGAKPQAATTTKKGAAQPKKGK